MLGEVMRLQRAFTLIELLVVVALAAVVLTLAAPSFMDFILLQRLKSISAQLTTDLQLARSEAVSRNIYGRVVFSFNDSMSCYTLYTVTGANPNTIRCNCLLAPGSACTNPNSKEIRTVQVPKSLGVRIATVGVNADPAIAFDPVTGALLKIPMDDFTDALMEFKVDTLIDAPRTLRTTIGRAGRPTICGMSVNLGATAC